MMPFAPVESAGTEWDSHGVSMPSCPVWQNGWVYREEAVFEWRTDPSMVRAIVRDFSVEA